MPWSAPHTVQCHPCRGTGWEVDSCRGGSALAPLGAGLCSWWPSTPFLCPCVCWRWHNAIPVPSSSIPPPFCLLSPTSLLSQAPGASFILLTHCLSLLKDNPCQGFLDNPPASSLPDQVPSLSCSHLHAPASLPWALIGWCHINSVPQGLPAPFPVLILSLLPQTQAPLPSSPQNTHSCNSTATCSTRPAQPGFSSHFHPSPSPSPQLVFSLWSRESRKEGLASNRTACSYMLQAGPAFQRKLCLGSGGGCYLVTMTGFFLCDLDMAGSHQLRSPNGRFPVEAFQDAP